MQIVSGGHVKSLIHSVYSPATNLKVSRNTQAMFIGPNWEHMVDIPVGTTVEDIMYRDDPSLGMSPIE